MAEHHREALQDLIAQKDTLEREIADLQRTLPSKTEQLVDEEGFPRADVDVHAIRIGRNQLARYQNDHKAVMAEIERAIVEYHGSIGPQHERKDHPVAHLDDVAMEEVMQPFFVVDQVFPDSPAEQCGIQAGDLIMRFGRLNHMTYSNTALINLVKHKLNQPIPILVRRTNDQIMPFTVTPREWSGQGYLGCHFSPIKGVYQK